MLSSPPYSTRNNPQEGREEDIGDAEESRDGPEEDDDRYDNDEIVGAAHVVHPLRRTQHVRNPFAVLDSGE